MMTYHPSHFAADLADHIIRDRFARDYSTTSWAEYRARLDRRAVAHLPPQLVGQSERPAASHRRLARFYLENASTLIIVLPLRDNRTGETVWVKTEFASYLDATERGAIGSWNLAYKSPTRPKGQVKTAIPGRGNRPGPSHAPVARVIKAAQKGQQVRTIDGNLVGNPGTAEGRVGTAKTNTLDDFRAASALTDYLARRKGNAQ